MFCYTPHVVLKTYISWFYVLRNVYYKYVLVLTNPRTAVYSDSALYATRRVHMLRSALYGTA